MLRFQDDRRQTKSPGIPGRARLWLLVLALGLVLVAMRQMEDPALHRRLGHMFGLSSEPASLGSPATSRTPGQRLSTDFRSTGEPGGALQRASTGNLDQADWPGPEGRPGGSPPIDSELLSRIEDNTSFRPKERPAWFALFGRLKTLSNSTLHGWSIGQLSYAQLVSQPDAYRGRVVTVRGTVIREEVEYPSNNPLGLAEYHRLWLKPAGGGQWPFVVYALQLPDRFPRGDGLRMPISVTGFFFKNWSYSWGDGMGLAPVILASGVAWTLPVAGKQPVQQVDWKGLALGVALAMGVALLVLFVAWRQTARRPMPASGRDVRDAENSIGESLRQLARQGPLESDRPADGDGRERREV